jgi:hypothetical protein
MSFTRFSAPVFAVAASLFPISALAQSANWQLPPIAARYRNAAEAQAPYYEAHRSAYDRGYQEGRARGEEDARRGDRFAYQDEREFQRADRGYHRGFGDRERYRQIFRDGFASGYSNGYSRYSRYGRYEQGPYGSRGPYGQSGGYGSRGGGYGAYGGGYYSPALDNGIRDGYEKGREDVRKNRSFDPRRHSWYRSGDRHYEREYGPKERYEDVYRRGFQEGYERGYRESRYRW